MILELLELLFPTKCPFCGKLLKQGQTLLCPDCQRDLPWTQGERQKVEFVSQCVSPLWYRDLVRLSHHRYKFRGIQAYAVPYARLMAQCVNDRLQGEFDMITWVPLSRFRRWRRGYDQAQLLAERLGEELGTPCEPLLRKVRNTKAQSGLKGESRRRANVLGAYAACRKARPEGRRILLVDDVVTTGSTLSECARMLLSVGAAQVVCVTLAMAGGAEERKVHK